MNSFVSFYFEIPCLASLLAFSIYTLFCFKRLSFRANKAPLFSVMSSNWAPNVRDTRSRITMDIIISASVVTTPKSPWFSAPSKLFVFCGQLDDLCWDCYLYLLLNYWPLHRLSCDTNCPLMCPCPFSLFVIYISLSLNRHNDILWFTICTAYSFFKLNSTLKFFFGHLVIFSGCAFWTKVVLSRLENFKNCRSWIMLFQHPVLSQVPFFIKENSISFMLPLFCTMMARNDIKLTINDLWQ